MAFPPLSNETPVVTGSSYQPTTGKAPYGAGKKNKAKKKPKKPDPLVRPAAPGSSYTERAMRQLIASLVGAKYGEAEQGLAKRERDIPAWFQSYLNTVNQAKAAQKDASDQQVTSLQGMAAQAAGDTGGFANDPVAQAAAAIRSAGVTNQAALAQNLAGNQQAYLGNIGTLIPAQQQQALTELGAMRTQLAKDKGEFRVGARQDILDAEQKARLEQAVFGLKAQDAKLDVAKYKTDRYDKKKKRQIARKKVDQAAGKVNQYGYTDADWRAMTVGQRQAVIKDFKGAGKGGDGKDAFGNTKAQQRAATDSYRKAYRSAKRYYGASESMRKDPEALLDFLVAEKGLNDFYASYAVKALTGKLGPKARQALKKRGVTWFPKTSAAPPYKGPDQAPGDTKDDAPAPPYKGPDQAQGGGVEN